ncbi:MAG TPA: rhomboid family intramembrane serine protease [archaeon]|nr:rhomboid family intramembrane serine protease [archaeon]
MNLPFYYEKEAKLTYFLIAVMIAVFFLESYYNYRYGTDYIEDLFRDYGFSLNNLLEGKWWTLLTSIFLHAGPEHLILNLIALFFFSKAIEPDIGWKKVLLIFIASGIAGNLFVMGAAATGIMPVDIPTIGASAAIFGIMGAAMFIKPVEPVLYPYLIPVPLISVAVVYAFLNFVQFFLTATTGLQTDIAYVAHIGGLLIGAYFGFRQEGIKKGIFVILGIIIILVALPSIFAALQYLESTNYLNVLTTITQTFIK